MPARQTGALAVCPVSFCLETMTMRKLFPWQLLGVAAAIAACHSATPAPQATPQPAAAAPGRGQGAAQAPAGRAGGRGPAISPESLSVLRKASVAEVLRSIQGRDSLPAEQVFRDIRVLKGVPAGRLVTMMDEVYGAGLGMGCNGCHIVGQWADSTRTKATARTMATMAAAINSQYFANQRNIQRVNCVTCHRGARTPATSMNPGRGGRGG
jgi:Photosynthetic reaction centre cytochrome C subunit